MRVSIIIAAYNAADTLVETIDTVAAQTYRDFELIVVDDGSRDHTSQVLATHAPRWPWMRTVRQDNAGVSAARERGISIARGDWIAFLDADDLWMPRKLEAQMAVVEAQAAAQPALSLVCTDSQDFIGERDLPKTLFQEKSPARGQVLEALFSRNFIMTSTALVRRSAHVAAGGFDRAKKVNEDFDLWLRLAADGGFDYVDEVLVRHRILPSSLTRANQRACYEQDLAIIDDWVQRRPDLFAPDAPIVRRRRGLILSRLGYQRLAERDFAGARKAYGEAVSLGQRDRVTLFRWAASALPPLAFAFWRLKEMRRKAC